MTNPILEAALDLAAHGYSVLPIRADGSKSPAVPWKPYTEHAADEATIRAWFTDTNHGLGVVTGPVSRQLEMLEVEGRAAHHLPQLRQLANDTGLGELWARVTTGWTETSPSGGFHFHYHLTDQAVPGNTKIARDETGLVLAETRGAGGQVVIAPTPGTHHPSGNPWTRLIGTPATAATITSQERAALHALLATLDRTPPPAAPAQPASPPRVHDGLTPGDDYENKVDWADILQPHGWTHVATQGHTRYWLRPGGSDTGARWSASTGRDPERDRLYVFSSSTDFELEVPYTKLGAYCVLNGFGNDYSAAARALARAGYGEPATRLAPGDDLAGLIAPATNGDTSWTSAPAATTAPSTSATSAVASTDAASDSTSPEPSGTTPAPERPAATITEERPAQPNQDNTALLLIDAHQHEIRYTPGRGTWLTWNGHRWVADDIAHVQELVRAIARRLPAGDGWDTYRKKALTANGVAGVLQLARSDPRIVAPTPLLDARPYELNTPGGTIDLRTGALHPADPAALHTRTTAVTPDPRPTPLWDTFLADTFAGDPTMTTYLQRLLGLSLVGVVLEQLFPFAHGAGANGKTTLLSVAQHLAGMGESGYAMSAPATMLLASRSEGHPTELARLSGARLVVTSELEDGQRFAEAKIKLLTGKDTITGRFMRQDWFDFTPTHTLWLLANHQPEVRAGGTAFWRRIRLIPFAHTVPPEKRIPDLEDKLIAQEGPGILHWMIQGAADYFHDGLAEPDSVSAATQAYELDQDTVARFVADACELGNPNSQVHKCSSGAVRAAYERWCRIEGEDPVTVKAMTTALRTRFGVIPERSHSGRFLAGIRILDDPEDEEPDASRHEPEGDDGLWYQKGW